MISGFDRLSNEPEQFGNLRRGLVSAKPLRPHYWQLSWLVRGRLALKFSVVIISAYAGRAELVTNLVPTADTSLLESNPDNNLGALVSIPAGTTSQGRSRTLFKFDLSGIPSGAGISAVEFTVWAVAQNSQHPGSIFALHRLLKNWGEGVGSVNNSGDPATTNAATWNNRFHPLTPWGTAGGAAGVDFNASFSATNFIDTLTNYTFGSTTGLVADVQLWINNPEANFGWIFLSQSEATTFTVRRFASREDAIRSPVLIVHYIPPPVISSVSVSGNRIHFTFSAESNRTYTVETRNDVKAGNWVALTNIPAASATTIIEVNDPITNLTGFYRVRSP